MIDLVPNRPAWAAFCIYGPAHVEALRRLLLPALARQRVAGETPPVFLLNYLANQPLLADLFSAFQGGDLSAVRSGGRLGFGESANLLFRLVRPERGFFLINPDCIPFPGCFEQLASALEHHENAGIVEARQWPLEHPKEFDANTGETPWASCACCLLPSAPFAAIDGFDPIYFLYNEDVDLSWRLRLAGYRAIYVPEAVAAHYTGIYSYRSDRYYAEHYYSSRNFLALSYKFFGNEGERQAIALLKASRFPPSFQETIIAAYQRLKPFIHRYPGQVDSERFRITGLNLYHELRFQY